MDDACVSDVVTYLQSQMTEKGGWKVTYRYKADGYLVFDQGKKEGDWVTYIISNALDQKKNMLV